MSDVFLSYSRENQDTARLFAEALQRAGLSVWWDDTLSAGDDRGLQASDHVRVAADGGPVPMEGRHARSGLAPLSRLRLAYWSACFGDAQGALDLLHAEYRRSPSTTIVPTAMWRPTMRDVRRLPVFKPLVRDLGLVDFWRKTVWPDLCKPVGADDFECH